MRRGIGVLHPFGSSGKIRPRRLMCPPVSRVAMPHIVGTVVVPTGEDAQLLEYHQSRNYTTWA